MPSRLKNKLNSVLPQSTDKNKDTNIVWRRSQPSNELLSIYIYGFISFLITHIRPATGRLILEKSFAFHWD